MKTIDELEKDLRTARSEIKNLRQNLMKLKATNEKENAHIKDLLSNAKSITLEERTCKTKEEINCFHEMKPIGYIRSCFSAKNGIPRQASLSTEAKAVLEIERSIFTNPEHSLIALEEFSHIWVIFVFHKNSHSSHIKAKVHPPRLNGRAVGVFSTRSPHRPNAIGLSLVKLDKIEGNMVHLAGVDLLDGTPVLDIKPYIPSYDSPHITNTSFLEANGKTPSTFKEIFPAADENVIVEVSESYDSETHYPLQKLTNSKESCTAPTESSADESKTQFNTTSHNIDRSETCITKCATEVAVAGSNVSGISTAEWIRCPPVGKLTVQFTPRADHDVTMFHNRRLHEKECNFCLNYLSDSSQVKQLICDTLRNDPRSVYRRTKCSDRLYFHFFDTVHITSWFDDQASVAEVLRVQPLNIIKNVT